MVPELPQTLAKPLTLAPTSASKLAPKTKSAMSTTDSGSDSKTSSTRSGSTSAAVREMLRRTTSGMVTEDPLTRALVPPVDESPEEELQRQKAEQKARKLSEEIDKYLKKDGELQKEKRNATVRLLLLGQSESGKSTALKNFQLLYNPQSFQAERLAWRLVILFNLVHSIRILHHVISEALAKQQQDEEDTDARDVSLGKSPTSPLFSRSPLPDFQDLLPPLPDPAQIQAHKQSNGRPHHGLSLSVNFGPTPGSPPLSPADLDPDLTDAASSHSAGSHTNAAKPNIRRSSMFSSSKSDRKSLKVDQKRPATSTGLSPPSTMSPTSTLWTPTSGSSGPSPLKTSSSMGRTRFGTGSDDESKYPRSNVFRLHKSRSRDSLTNPQQPKSPIKNALAAESNSSLITNPTLRQQQGPRTLRFPHSIPPAQNFPDLKWGAQHRILLMRLKPLLTIEMDLLRRLSIPEENEPVRLDFNLPERHNIAVRMAISGGKNKDKNPKEDGTDSKRNSSENSTSGVNLAFGRSISTTGRPRARSSVDIHLSKSAAEPMPVANSGATSSTSSLDNPIPFDRRRSDDVAGSSLANNISTKARVLIPSGDGVVIPEFFVRSTVNWKEKLKKLSKYDPTATILGKDEKGLGTWEWNPWDDDMDPAHFIQTCARDVMALWEDATVQEYLKRNKYRMEHTPGFFLPDVERITSRNYIPTDDDILRARIKTIGVTEHKLTIDSRLSSGTHVPKEWLIYDVGGARTQRAAWLPYFDTTDAIIFIASLSSFDQVLSEDPNINRMEDSLRLFRTIVSTPILKDVNIILFLNKMDLLDSKIQSGIQVAQHFKRYGDRPNTTEAVSKYFKAKFTAIFEKFTPPHSKRLITIHTTSLTNPKSTKIILEAVSESIVSAHMRNHGIV